MTTARKTGVCCELVPRGHGAARFFGDYDYCGAAAAGNEVTLLVAASGTPLSDLGRPAAHAGPYCELHGGRARAEVEARRDWGYLAPDSVGAHGAVLRAGGAGLTSPNAYVVIRQAAPEERPELYRVSVPADQRQRLVAACDRDRRRLLQVATHCGLVGYRSGPAGMLAYASDIAPRGPLTTADRARAERAVQCLREAGIDDVHVEVQPAGTHRQRKPWLASLGVGGFTHHVGAYQTREEALVAVRAAWERRLHDDIAAIRRARGGTLDWGMPVEPLAEPTLLEPRAGESGWDCVGREPRRAPSGLAAISGVRSSGEAY